MLYFLTEAFWQTIGCIGYVWTIQSILIVPNFDGRINHDFYSIKVIIFLHITSSL